MSLSQIKKSTSKLINSVKNHWLLPITSQMSSQNIKINLIEMNCMLDNTFNDFLHIKSAQHIHLAHSLNPIFS